MAYGSATQRAGTSTPVESFLKMVGITQEHCSNFGWGDVLHPDDTERTIKAWKECATTDENSDIEHRFRGKDGKWHDVLARGSQSKPIRKNYLLGTESTLT